MSKSSIVTLIALCALILLGLLGYKEQRAAATAREAREGASALIERRQFYRDNREYIESLFDSYHDEAWEKAYSHGGLFAPAEFDEQAYQETLFVLARRQALKDGRSSVVYGLPAFGEEKPPPRMPDWDSYFPQR